MKSILSVIRSWPAWLATQRWLIGPALMRIGFGLVTASLLVQHVRDREFMFGPNGILPWPVALQYAREQHIFNIFLWNSSDAYFNLVYFGGMLVAIAFLLGWQTRIVTPLFTLVTWSLYHRDPYLMDGGYRLMTILLIYLIPADLGRYFSVDAWLTLRSTRTREPLWISTMLHNTAIIACLVQVCFVYLFSTFYKITGEEWQHGTAVYYALSDIQFSTGAITDLIRSNPLLLSLAAYATLLYQSAFPWLVWHPRLKFAVIGGAILFHGSIGLAMGLFWFSVIMITCEFIFLTDSDYARVRSWFETSAEPQLVPAA